MQRRTHLRSGQTHRTAACAASGGPGDPEPSGTAGRGPALSRRSMMKALGLGGAAAVAGPGLEQVGDAGADEVDGERDADQTTTHPALA